MTFENCPDMKMVISNGSLIIVTPEDYKQTKYPIKDLQMGYLESEKITVTEEKTPTITVQKTEKYDIINRTKTKVPTFRY